jgi:hypothetical protein
MVNRRQNCMRVLATLNAANPEENYAAGFCGNSMRGNNAGISGTDFYGDRLDGYFTAYSFLNLVMASWSARLFRDPSIRQ